MINSIRIVLVNPSHPGNIGSVARAMKTMGLSELYLVSPKSFPDAKATALATHAEDILDSAVVVPDLMTAIQDVQTVYATSANTRDVNLPILSARDAALKIRDADKQEKTAILFGPESSGLSNQELLYANELIQIPTAESYHSLNLAQAVQIIVYECHMAFHQEKSFNKPLSDKVTVKHLEYFYQNLEKISVQLKLINPENPRQFMQHMRRLFNRADLNDVEINLLNSVLNGVTHLPAE